jgi:hypothetical protein
VEQLIVAWLKPLGRTGAERRSTDALPFRLVTHVAGSENVAESTAELVVSVHTLCDKTLGMAPAAAECKTTHRRMLYLAQHISDVALVNTRLVNVDYVTVVESPRWEYYSDQILRKIARYAVGLTYTAVV